MANGNGTDNNGSQQWIWIVVVIIVIILIILVIGGIIWANNGDNNRGLGESCGSNSDCSGNLVCQNRSNPGSSSNRVCLSQNGGSCGNVNDCVNGLICLDNHICGNPLL